MNTYYAKWDAKNKLRNMETLMRTLFEAEVMEKLGAVLSGQDSMQRQISTIFHKLDGNGQPGISQRLTSLETTCRRVQEGKAVAAGVDDSRSNRNWRMYSAIAGAIVSPFVVILVEIIRGK
jgi:hypothetical protein